MTTVAPPQPTTVSPPREDQPPWRFCHIVHEYNGNLCGSIGPAVLAEDTRRDRDGRCAYCHALRCPRCAALLSEGVR